MSKISIILPVYNAEQTIEKCIRSIQRQSYRDFELLIINDGSIDQSTKICKEFASRDSRIHYYYQEHQGVASARNQGLDLAIGKYVQFVDSDDYLETFSCKRMLEGMKEESIDLVVDSYKTISIDGYSKSKNKLKGLYLVKEYAALMAKDTKDYYFGVLWNKMYKMKIISDAHIRFSDEIVLGEDFIFNITYLYHAAEIYAITSYGYYYVQLNENSLVRKKKNADTRIQYRTNMYIHYRRFMMDYGLYERYKKEIENYMVEFAYYEYVDALWKDRKQLSFRARAKRCAYVNQVCLKEFGLDTPLNQMKIKTRIMAWYVKRMIAKITRLIKNEE